MVLGSLGAVSYDIVAKDKTAKGLDNAGDRARKIGMVAGAAVTGIGVAMIALTDSAKKTNATIRQTALQLGVTAEEMRELTLETTNVTFPISEVTASFDLLTRAGMTNKEQIAVTATAFDTLGDAVGKTASEVTGPMVTAMKTFGLEISEGADYTDKMTYLLRNTTLEMDNFSSIIAKIPPDIVEMGLTMDDTIALLGLMEKSGLSGAVATREFQKAVTAARKSGEPLNEVLGFTSEQLDEYKVKLEGATGMTAEYADAANTQYGTMDKLRHTVSELTLKYGSMLEPLDALGPAMATLGPIMIMASTIQWGTLIPALSAHAVAAWAAIAPYLVIIAPIVAVIAILYVLEKKFGIVTKAVELAREGFGKAVDFLKGIFTRAIEEARDIIGRFGDKLLFLLGPIGAVIYAFRNWEEILGIVTGVFDSIMSYIGGLYSKFTDAGANIVQALIDGIKSLIGKPKELIEEALGTIADMLPFSPAKTGPLAKLPNWESYLVEPMKAARISPGAMFEPGIGGERRGGAERPPIEVKIETTIYNYSDVEEFERMTAEAVQRGIHDAYGTR